MPYVRKSDGSYAVIDEGETPPAGARVVNLSSLPSGRANPYEKEIQRRLDTKRKLAMPGDAAKESIAHNWFLGTDDNIASGVSAAFSGVGAGAKALFRGENPLKAGAKAAGREYEISQEADRRYRQEQGKNHPVQDALGTVVGSVMLPIKGAAGAVPTGQSLRHALAAPGPIARKVAKVPGLKRVAHSNIARAGAVGGTTSAAQAAGDTYYDPEQGAGAYFDEMGNRAKNAGIAGVALGSGIGAAVRGVTGATRAIRDRAPENATDKAYDLVGKMVGRAPRGSSGMRFTPESATREMQVSAARGNEPMLADLSPEMQNTSGYLARNPALDNANEMVLRGEGRIDGGADRFDKEVRRALAPDTGQDAIARFNQLESGRKAAAQAGYSEDVMGKPFEWNDRLEALVNNPTPFMKRALNSASDFVRGFRDPETLKPMDPTKLGWQFDPNGNVKYVKIPTMEVFDAVKKGFDAEIARVGWRSPDGARLSQELQMLRRELGEVNPQYAQTLATQRDFFQRENSLQLGNSFLKRIRSSDPQGARKLLAEMKADKIDKSELQTGFVDALLAMRNSGTSPGVAMRKFLKNPHQREVLAYAFGDMRKLNQFSRFIEREARAGRTDAMLARGRQSATGPLKQAGEALDDGGAAATLASTTTRGGAYGGTVGAVSGFTQGLKMLKSGMGPAAQDELARILMGRGEGLAEGVAAAGARATDRGNADLARALMAGRLANTPFGPQQ